MASESTFLNLPRELRDDIYRFYVTFENGLVYNFAYEENANPKSQNILRNLAPSNKKDRIDLALRSTCKQVHKETEGLILKFNTITFSNTRISRSNSDEVRVRAARFHYLRVPLTMDAAAFLYYEDGTVVRPCYTSTIVDEVVRTHPLIGPLLRTLLEKDTHWAEIGSAHKILQARPHDHCPDEGPGPTGSWGMVPSVMRRAIMHALQVTADHGCFGTGPAAQRLTSPPREMLALDSEFPAWSIPTDDDLLKLSRPYAWKATDPCDDGNFYCHSSRQRQTTEFWNGPQYYKDTFPEILHVFISPQDTAEYDAQSHNRGKFRFSAASVAISFLSSLPSKVRLHLRRLRLLENDVCVAFPESHAQGLISFCLENPRLRVERRVNLWKAIFQQPNRHGPLHHSVNELDGDPEGQYLDAKTDAETGFSTDMITDNLALWIMEAAALVPAGMPENSFTLVLDGAPGNDVLLGVFMNFVQRDAAWQRAWEIASERATGKPETDDHFLHLRGPRCYLYEGFPQVIGDIVNHRSKLIQCTFNPGPQLWDPEAELDKYQPHSAEIWDKLRHEHSGKFYWRQLEPHERFPDLVYKREILPYDSGDEYFSD